MLSKKRLLTILVALLALPVIAAAPETLSVLFNGRALEGKALWYDGKIYVPLESVAEVVDGRYSYDQKRGTATVDFAAAPGQDSRTYSKGPVRTDLGLDRPHLQVAKQQVFSTGDNMKVLATVVNKGQVPARQLEVTCTFRSSGKSDLVASVAQLPELKPGERRTLEFWLFEQRIPDTSGGRPYAQPMSVPGSYLGKGENYVFIGMDWQRVTYDLDFDYLNPDNTYTKKRG